MSYAGASAVHRIDELAWQGEVTEDWDIFGATNGGYLMVMAARAMSATAGNRVPVSVTAHFLRPVSPGPIRVEVSPVKEGRALSTLRAEMLTGQGPVLTLLGAFADPDRMVPDVSLSDGAPPDLPPVEECVRLLPAGDAPLPPPLMAQFDLRLHPEDAGGLVGRATGRALVRGWFRLLDREPLDAFLPLLAADSFPPAIFNADLPMAWTPTVEMTTHIREVPAQGWLRCRFHTRFISGGFLEEDGEVWDEQGRMVALSRQLALVPR